MQPKHAIFYILLFFFIIKYEDIRVQNVAEIHV